MSWPWTCLLILMGIVIVILAGMLGAFTAEVDRVVQDPELKKEVERIAERRRQWREKTK